MAERAATSSYYELLEVGANATFEEIERSYRRIAAYLGPDSLAVYSIFDVDEADRLRAQLDEAYRTLSDPDRRAAYDRARAPHESVARAPEISYPPVVVPAQTIDTSVSVTQGGASPRVPVEPAPEPPPSPAAARIVASGQAGKRRRLQVSPHIDIGPDTEFGGAMLQRLRESAEATLDEVAEITKVSKHYLLALEKNDFQSLPAAVYVRGFVSEYARVLGLDPQRVAKSYMSLFTRYRREGG